MYISKYPGMIWYVYFVYVCMYIGKLCICVGMFLSLCLWIHTHTLYTRRNVLPVDMKTRSRYLQNAYTTNSGRDGTLVLPYFGFYVVLQALRRHFGRNCSLRYRRSSKM